MRWLAALLMLSGCPEVLEALERPKCRSVYVEQSICVRGGTYCHRYVHVNSRICVDDLKRLQESLPRDE